MAAPGLGPYQLCAPTTTCTKHRDRVPRTHPHRCDSCVQAITMCVFDADRGTEQDIQHTHQRLKKAHVAHVFYSSFSYASTPTVSRAAYRLVIPLATPVPPASWVAFRQLVGRAFSVPADLSQCTARSHLYFLPVCPPDASPRVIAHPDAPLLDAEAIAAGTGVNVSLTTPPTLISNGSFTSYALDEPHATDAFELPPEPVLPSGLDEHYDTIEHLRRHWAGKPGPDAKRKATYLRHLLAREPLAEHGDRNNATLITAGMLAWLLPDVSLGTLKHIMRPSVEAMLAAGSSLTWRDVETMLVSGMHSRWEQRQRDRSIEAAFGKLKESIK